MGTDERFARLDALVADRAPSWIAELGDLCRIPSEASDPAALSEAADWVRRRLEAAAADVQVLGRDGLPPLVVGMLGDQGPVLNAVQHYDVQPADPVGLWSSPPYEPAIRDGRLFARGAADNKGHLLLRIQALEAYREAFGGLPCRVRFIVEGEEESGSANLGSLLDLGDDLRRADGALQEGGGIDDHERPLLICGVRGIVYVELSVRTLSFDAHSGGAQLFPNAAWRLVEALGTMWSNNGRVLIDGFYDDVRPPTAAQLEHMRQLPFEEEEIKSIYGVGSFVAGRTGGEAHAAMIFEPTCNLAGIWSGWTGAGSKTITPAQARAKLDMRLVPDQRPDVILENLRRHLAARGYDDIEVEDLTGEHPYWSPIDAPIVDAAAQAAEEVFGQPALRIFSSAGTAPMHEICATHAVPMVALGCGDHRSRAHAPDESISLDRYEQAIRATGRFVRRWAEAAS